MVHSLLSGLPDIYDDEVEGSQKMRDIDVYIPLEGELASPATSSEATHLDGRSSVGEAEGNPPEDSGENALGPIEGRSEEEKGVVEGEKVIVQEVLSDTAAEPLEEIKELVEELSLSNDVATSSADETQELYPRLMRPRVSLSSLLVAADELYEKYPPTHREISLTSIMGPQSVVFTWSESQSEMPDDDEAERMVEKPELIVRPYTEPHTEKSDTGPGSEKQKRRRKQGTFLGGRVERRTVVAGAVLTIGVAVAVYGARTRSLNGTSVGKDGVKDWQMMGMWLGGSLMSAGERIFGTKEP